MIVLDKRYKRLITEDSRYYICTGGRASGKSYGISSFLLMLTFEPNHKILFTRYTMVAANISIIPEFISKIEILNLQDKFEITKNEIINKLTGSSIIFKGIKTSSGIQTANLKSISGITTWVLDEGEELVDEDVFNKIDLSIRTKENRNRVIIIMNPCTKEHFIYKKFFEDMGVPECSNTQKNDVSYIHSSYLDNKDNISQSLLYQIEEMKVRNPSKYDHIMMGKWLDRAEGVIFNNWTIGEFKETDKLFYGTDFGFSIDPSTCVKVSFDNDTIYCKEIFHRQGMITQDFIIEYKQLPHNSLIIADSAEPRLINEIKKQDINIIPIEKNPGSIVEGITFIKDYKLIIDPSSTNLIRELNNYSWSNSKAGIPIDKWNHCFIGSTLITTKNGYKKIKDINVGDFVLTSNGYNKVIKTFNNGKKQVKKYRMETDTFNIYVICTPDHKIKTDEGWKEISKLQQGMMVYLDRNLMENNIHYMKVEDTSVGEERKCTGLFGNIIMGKEKKDITFITSMKILGTILFKTLKKLNPINIYQNTLKKDILKILNGQKCLLNWVLNLPKSGILQKKDLNGTNNKQLMDGSIENTQHIIVKNVVKNLHQDTEINHQSSGVITIAKLRLVEEEDLNDMGQQIVYDIMVENEHEYFANGLLVHNCIDPIRYIVMYNKKHNQQFDYSFSAF